MTPADVLQRVVFAQNVIQASKKQSVADYDEDLRALRSLMLKLGTAEYIAQPELFDVETMLSPEVKRLLEAPLAKYSGR